MNKYHKNPRVLTEKQFKLLERDLKELGDLSGIVHDINSNEIISGNQRVSVFTPSDVDIEIIEEFDPPTKTGTIATGWIKYNGERYSYRRVKWTPEKCEKANIVANKAGGSWDWDILANRFDIDDLLNWGFDKEELSTDSNALDNIDNVWIDNDYLSEEDIKYEVLSFNVPVVIKKQIERIIKFISDGKAIISSFPSMEIDLDKFEPVKNISQRKISKEEALYAFIAISFYNHLTTMKHNGKKIYINEIVLDEKQVSGLYNVVLNKIKDKYKDGIPRNPINEAILDIINDS